MLYHLAHALDVDLTNERTQETQRTCTSFLYLQNPTAPT